MSIDGLFTFIGNHPWLSFYLCGVIVAALLWIARFYFFWCIDWVIRADVLKHNMKKILPPDEETKEEKEVRIFKLVFLNVIFSWFSVIDVLWSLVIEPLRIMRDQIQPAPQKLLELRFPLRNNPEMAREYVAATSLSLTVCSGHSFLDAVALYEYLLRIQDFYPSFDITVTLKELQRLGLYDEYVISQAESLLR